MNDEHKDKSQLIAELQELRKRIQKLEIEISDLSAKSSDTNLETLAWQTLMSYEQMPVEIYVKDRNHKFIDANQATIKIHQMSHNQIIGLTDSNLPIINESNATKNLEEEKNVLSTGEPVIERLATGQKDNGSKRWVYVTKLPIIDENHNVVGIVGINYDVSEIVITRTTATQRYNLLRTVIDNMPINIFVKDNQDRYICSNKAHAKFHGFDNPDQVEGKTTHELFLSTDLADDMIRDDQLILNGVKEQVEHEELMEDIEGNKHWLLTTKVPLKSVDSDRIVGLVGIGKNVTAIHQQRNLLHHLINSIPDFVYIKDSSSRFVLANQALADVLGLESPDELINKQDSDFYPPDLARKYLEDEKALIDKEVPQIKEDERGLNRKNEKIWVHTTKTPILDPDGNVQYIVGIGHDVTSILEPYDDGFFEEALQLELEALLNLITKRSMQITQTRSSGLYRYDPLNKLLILVAQTNRNPKLKTTIKYGEGIAGSMVAHDLPELYTPDYSQSSYVITGHEGYVGMVYARLLKSDDQIVGVLYVEDEVDTVINKRRLEIFDHHVNYTALVLDNTLKMNAERETRNQLVELARINPLLMADLQEMSKSQRLKLIAEHAANILKAEACTVLLLHQEKPNVLVHEESYGYQNSTFQGGEEFEIGDQIGLTGFIASQGKPFKICGDDYLSHQAVASSPESAPLGKGNSLLMIPLRNTQSNQIVGWLRLDNKKDDLGESKPNICFTDEDILIAQLFADTVVTILQAAEMQTLLHTLIDTIPDYIYIKDKEGRFVVVNKETATRMNREHPRELQHLTDADIYTGEYAYLAELYRQTEIEVMETGDGQISFEEPIVNLKTGEEGTLLTTKVPWKDVATGKIKGIIGIGHDITSLRNIYGIADKLVTENTIKGILEITAQSVCKAGSADWVTIVLADNDHNPHVLLNYPFRNSFKTSKVRPNGLSARIISSGKMMIIPDIDAPDTPVINDLTRKLGFRAVVGLPMNLNKKCMGVVWLHYKTVAPDVHTDETLKNLQFHVQQATIAYDRIYKMNLLEQIQSAFQEVIKATVVGNYKETLRHIADGIQLVTKCDVVILYVFDRNSDRLLYDPELRGVEHPELIAKMIKEGGESFVYRMRRIDDIEKISNVADHDDIRDSHLAKEEGVKSLMIIPLKKKEHQMGMMFVGYRNPTNFEEHSIEHIELFASQAAVAIENDISYRQVESQTQTLRSLNDVGQAFSKSVEEPAILDATLSSALNIVDHLPQIDPIKQYISYVGLLNPTEDHLEILATPDKAMVAIIEKGMQSISLENPPIPSSIVVRVIKTSNPDIYNNVKNEDDFFDLGLGTHAQMVVLLKTPEKLLGILGVEAYEPDVFEEDDFKNLQTLADYAAVAIDRIRQFNDIQHREKQLSALREVTLAITSNIGLEDLLEHIIEQAVHLLDAKGGGLLKYDGIHHEFEVISAYNRPEAETGFRFDADKGLAGQLILPDSDRHLIIPDYSVWVGKYEHYALRDFRAMLGVTLIQNGQIIGVLNVDAEEGRVFTEYDAKLLGDFADQAAIAMDKNNNLLSLEHAWSTAQELGEITALSSINGTFEFIAFATQRAFQCDIITIYSYNESNERLENPIAVGVDPESILIRNPVPEDSITAVILADPAPYYESEDVPNDELFKNKEFAKLHNIQSCIGIPFRLYGETPNTFENVGIMFVNYQTQHRFTNYERKNLQLLANHAAIVIQNARQHEAVNAAKEYLTDVLRYRDLLRNQAFVSLSFHEEKSKLALAKRQAQLFLGNVTDKTQKDRVQKLLQHIEEFLEIIKRSQDKVLENEDAKSLNLHQLLDDAIMFPVGTTQTRIVPLYRAKQTVDPWIIGYEAHILHVFFVIIKNAIEELKGEGQLIIDSKEIDENGHKRVRISFADNGSGIPDDIAAKLRKGGETIPSTKAGGSGSGLSLAKHLMKLCGGDLTFDTQLDKGTTFYVTFSRDFRLSYFT